MPRSMGLNNIQHAVAARKARRSEELERKRRKSEEASRSIGTSASGYSENNAQLHPTDRSSPSASASLDIPHGTVGMFPSAVDLGTVPDDVIEEVDEGPSTVRPKHHTHKSEGGTRRRFSLLRFRHASDSALHQKAKAQAQLQEQQEEEEEIPPVPRTDMSSGNVKAKTPKIITTSPTMEVKGAETPIKKSWLSRASFDKPSRASTAGSSMTESPRPSLSQQPGSTSRTASSLRGSRVTFDEPSRPMEVIESGSKMGMPPPYDEHNVNSLHVPGHRLSESSRSTTSSGDHVYATTTTTTTTTTTFWRIPRRKKNRQSLFPLPPKVESEIAGSGYGHFPGDSVSSSRPSSARSANSALGSPPTRHSTMPYTDGRHSPAALAMSGLSFTGPAAAGLLRSDSQASFRSDGSTARPGTPRKSRQRSATMQSGEQANGGTSGRSSLGGFFGLRIRRDSEPAFNGGTPRNSSPLPSAGLPIAKSTEKLTIPERKDQDTPESYLARLENTVSKGVIATLLSANDDPFHAAVLKAYLDTFNFENDPMDMAIRKLLMEVELPRETQQIDRVLQAFAERYQRCNPDIFQNADTAYFIAFSLLILHTDVFNKANKHKMQKPDYLRNTQGEGVSAEVLECFYDNITYTPFIHLEDEFDINGEKFVSHKAKKGLFHRSDSGVGRLKEPLDPYTLIIDHRLDWLRPNLKDILQVDDPYNYMGTAKKLDMQELHRSFFRTGVLQIVSMQSRPTAFATPSTTANPQETPAGIVNIKITKVGTLWRKDAKKKRTRSPWQEWGVILTGSQLYFFRNLSWIKGLIEQYEKHQKNGPPGTPVIFNPPLQSFVPDAVLSTDDSVALLDSTYKRHKHAFLFVKNDGSTENILADDEDDMNDWMSKLNYAAAFRTSGIRMRGVIGNYEVGRSRGVRRLDSASTNSRSIQSDGVGRSGSVDPQMANEVAAARRQIMDIKIAEAEKKLHDVKMQLDAFLRTARHLAILTPIQQKTRTALVNSANNLTAKIKWVRMEMWKLQCHKDILQMDLEEERKYLAKDNFIQQASAPILATPSTSLLPRPRSATSDTPTPSLYGSSSGEKRLSWHAAGTPRPVTEQLDVAALDETIRRGSVASGSIRRSPSQSSVTSPEGKENLAPARPNVDTRPSMDSFRSNCSHSPTNSQTSLEEALANRTSKDFERRPSIKDKEKDKEKSGGLPKIKRGLQKTLREGHNIYAHRSKKSRDFSGKLLDKKKDESSDEEGLQRATPNFTVHGKKASIITFGDEWSAVSPEERLRRHRSSGTSVRREEGDDTSIIRRPSLAASAIIAEIPSETLLEENGEGVASVKSKPIEEVTPIASPPITAEKSHASV